MPSVEEPLPGHWSFGVWPQLLPDLAERIVGCLDRNDIAATFRRVDKATAEHFSGPQHTTIHLSQPVPPHAFAVHWLAPGATRGLNLERRARLVELTAASGALSNLKVAVRAAGILPTSPPSDFEPRFRAFNRAFEAAARAGQLATCQWLWDSKCLTDDGNVLKGAVVAAAHEGHRHVCEWLLGLGDPLANIWKAIEAAAGGGHAGLMEWLLQREADLQAAMGAQGRQGPPTAAQFWGGGGAAGGCDLPTLQRFWWAYGSPDRTTKCALLAAAASSPTPDWATKVEWLEAQGCPRTPKAAGKVIAMPNDAEALARLSWLLDRGYPIDEYTLLLAVRGGGTAAVLQYLLAVVPVGGFYAAHSTVAAAGDGHLEALKALCAAGWPTDVAQRAFQAALGGHVHVLAWLLEVDGAEAVGLNSHLFKAAAYSGCVELLAWLREHGCPWDCSAFSGVAGSGCEAALEWLVEQGCPMEDTGEPYVMACRNGDLAMARCLRRLGVPWGPATRVFLRAAEGGFRPAPLPMLLWMLREGCPVDAQAAQRVMEQRPPEAHQEADKALRLLLGGHPGGPSRAVGAALAAP
ncbi:hypothetical protein GPECTOR_47g364 [Gonium pectorale]|uniref:Uncharacterized protein n=1 Tax=Gonium pectorale TaxID=33097 RepID=A0A150G8E1_GONPE|nr:hypothetical protein GPECTOR_47g364 [Gonium pectorale]|eukprot:KXZ46088.1 hypothetical protein GPECTOR_47g364 [Gonium pectorale]